jgi:hypothetical protein
MFLTLFCKLSDQDCFLEFLGISLTYKSNHKTNTFFIEVRNTVPEHLFEHFVAQKLA